MRTAISETVVLVNLLLWEEIGVQLLPDQVFTMPFSPLLVELGLCLHPVL